VQPQDRQVQQSHVPVQHADGEILAVKRGHAVDAEVHFVAVLAAEDPAPVLGPQALANVHAGHSLEVIEQPAPLVFGQLGDAPQDSQVAHRHRHAVLVGIDEQIAGGQAGSVLDQLGGGHGGVLFLKVDDAGVDKLDLLRFRAGRGGGT